MKLKFQPILRVVLLLLNDLFWLWRRVKQYFLLKFCVFRNWLQTKNCFISKLPVRKLLGRFACQSVLVVITRRLAACNPYDFGQFCINLFKMVLRAPGSRSVAWCSWWNCSQDFRCMASDLDSAFCASLKWFLNKSCKMFSIKRKNNLLWIGPKHCFWGNKSDIHPLIKVGKEFFHDLGFCPWLNHGIKRKHFATLV